MGDLFGHIRESPWSIDLLLRNFILVNSRRLRVMMGQFAMRKPY